MAEVNLGQSIDSVIERLRNYARHAFLNEREVETLIEAADTITRLSADKERLEAVVALVTAGLARLACDVGTATRPQMREHAADVLFEAHALLATKGQPLAPHEQG